MDSVFHNHSALIEKPMVPLPHFDSPGTTVSYILGCGGLGMQPLRHSRRCQSLYESVQSQNVLFCS